MLKTFILVASMLNPAGQADTYVLDYGMTGEDCTAALVEAYEAPSVELEPSHVVAPAAVVLSCEIDGEQ